MLMQPIFFLLSEVICFVPFCLFCDSRVLGGCEQPVVFFDNSWSGSARQFEAELKYIFQTRMARHAVDVESTVTKNCASSGSSSSAGAKASIHTDGDDDDIVDDIAIDNLDFADVDGDFADPFVTSSSGGDSAPTPKRGGSGTVSDADSPLLQECLNRILVVRCKNSFEFLVSLGGLMLRPEIRDGSGFALVGSVVVHSPPPLFGSLTASPAFLSSKSDYVLADMLPLARHALLNLFPSAVRLLQVLIDSLSSFHLHDVSCPHGQVCVHASIVFLLKCCHRARACFSHSFLHAAQLFLLFGNRSCQWRAG